MSPKITKNGDMQVAGIATTHFAGKIYPAAALGCEYSVKF